jgi:hypothetical protein
MYPNCVLVVVHGLWLCLVGRQKYRVVLSAHVFAHSYVLVLPWNSLVGVLEEVFCFAVEVERSLLADLRHLSAGGEAPAVVISRQS